MTRQRSLLQRRESSGPSNATCHNVFDWLSLPLRALEHFFDDIGFCGDTEAVEQILLGTYDFPPDTDPATRLLCEEADITYAKMSQEELATYVTVEDFQHYWQRANERISSSYSGLHFGHYKAVSFNPELSALHVAKLNACARTGIPCLVGDAD